MRHLMLIYVRLLRKLLAARFACKRLFAGVHHEMALQIGQLIETLQACLADKWFLSSVNLLVLVEAALRRKGLVAFETLEALVHFGRMADNLMGLQLFLGAEILNGGK